MSVGLGMGLRFSSANKLQNILMIPVYGLYYSKLLETKMKQVYYYFREGNGNPFCYSCLENSMDRGAWQATVYGIAKSQT